MLSGAKVSRKDHLDRASIVSIVGKRLAFMRLDLENGEVG
jgi:hypothetical protein